MVLEAVLPRICRAMRPRRIAAVCAITLPVLAACIPQRPPVQAPAGHAVAVALLMEQADTGSVAGVPETVRAEIASALGARNLGVSPVELGRFAEAFAIQRLTERRLRYLASLDVPGDLLLLVEAHPRFYSQLTGRYRWTVQVRASLARRDAVGDALTTERTLPVFLDYAHEREAEALAAAGPNIAREVGAMVDDFVAGLDSAPAGGEGGAAGQEVQGDSIYFVLVDRFQNGDRSNDEDADPADPTAFHGGDLQGVIDRLDDLQALGVRTVWLSPVFAMRDTTFFGHGAFHGYWVSDFSRIEPRFGTEALLRRLSDELHRRGMRLLLDVVLNHVGYETPLVTEHPEWFHGRGPIEDWNDPDQLVNGDVHGLPDLAQEREDVYRHLVDTSLAWITRVRPDGFRLDAVKHMPASFWQRYNAEIRARAGAGFALLGEVLDGNPAVLAPLLRDDGFTHLFDFPLYFAVNDVFCRDQPLGRLAAVLYADRGYSDPRRLVTLLDNHDLPRIATACAGDTARVERAATFLLSARGVPSITYGTEAGLAGAEVPENRGDMRFGVSHPVGALIRRMLTLRAEHPVLASGASELLDVADDHLVQLRVSAAEAALVVVNRGPGTRSVEVPAALRGGRAVEAVGVRAIDDARLTVRAGSVTVALITPPPGGDFVALAAETLRRARTPARRSVELVAAGCPGEPQDRVVMVGSGPELGDWQASGGVQLERRSDDTFGATAELPVGGAFAFKLVMQRADGSELWEPGDNRHLFVASGTSRVELTWRAGS